MKFKGSQNKKNDVEEEGEEEEEKEKEEEEGPHLIKKSRSNVLGVEKMAMKKEKTNK